MSLSQEAMFNAIRSRFKTLVEDVADPALPTEYDNAPFQQPENTQWCRWSIRPASRTQMDVGSSTKRKRTVGVAIAQIFLPLEQGDKAHLVVADAIEAVFKPGAAAGVTYRTPEIVVVGRANDNKWWQVNVTCPFYADDVS